MSRIIRLLLAVAFGCGLLVASAAPAQAAPSQVTRVEVAAEPAFCFTSSPHTEWYGTGIYISHCDLQSLNVEDDVLVLVSALLAIGNPYLPAIMAAVKLYLSHLKSIDRGNGAYVLQSTVGPNVTYVFAA